MYKNHRIAVVLPAHNEARHIGQSIKSTPEFVDNVIVVDDSSSDDTLQVALACGDPRVTCLQRHGFAQVRRRPPAARQPGRRWRHDVRVSQSH